VEKRSGISREKLSNNTLRLADGHTVPDRSIDAVVSNSVLEHVAEPVRLFGTLHRILVNGGIMIHIVDYRDHFFKYPYHLLLFSKKTWRRWLDPGDLPGWRYSDHLRMLGGCGFEVAPLGIERNIAEFDKIRPFISDDYDRKDPALNISACVLVARGRL
jgi:SAM-dependent methyltransferase